MYETIATGIVAIASVLAGAFAAYKFGVHAQWLRDERTRIGRLKTLLSEIQENRLIADNPSLAGGRAKARFQSDAWRTIKGDIDDLPGELSDKLMQAYIRLSKYNDLVDYDLYHSQIGGGHFNPALAQLSEEIKPYLRDSGDSLRTYLAQFRSG